MVIEISVACIAGAFVILAVFLIICIVKTWKTIKETNALLHSLRKDLNEISEEGVELLKHMNELTADVKRKMHAVDYLIKPLKAAKEDIESEEKKMKGCDLTSDILECLAAGMVIFNKIKGGIREYGKNR